MTTHSVPLLARRLLAVLGATLLVPACIGDLVDLDVDTDTDTGGSDTGGPSTGGPGTGGPSTTSASATSANSSTPSTDEGEVGGSECGAPISMVVCVDPFGDGTGSGSSTGFGTTGSDDETGPGDGGTAATDDAASGDASAGSESTGSASVSCEGVDPHDYSFCVYEEGEVYEQDGQCCRLLEGYAECCDGRPFIVGDEIRTAPAVRRADWMGYERPTLAGLGAAERAALAAAWQADGAMEHASIASFARFVLHLLALGAPPSLVIAAQQAMADEVEHARRCFALAGAYAGEPVGPGPLAIEGALAGPISLREAAVAAVVEGCIGETLAAHQALAAAEVEKDPVVRRVLEGIAEDEARHAELAWRFVAWALGQGGAEVHEAVARAFTGARSVMREEDEREAPIAAGIWRAHGRLTPRGLARTLARGHREIIEPCARVLLADVSGEGALLRGSLREQVALAA
jgi:hypothetical protein